MDKNEGQNGHNDAIAEGILFLIGLYIIYVSNWNWFVAGLGVMFASSPVLQIPAIRIYINNKTGHQFFRVHQSHISGSNVVGSAREVHFHEAPKTIIQHPEGNKERPRTVEPEWE